MKKFLLLTSVTLLILTAFLLYHIFVQATTIDDTRMSVINRMQREECLLKMAQAFASSHTETSLREWAKANLGDLDYYEEDRQLIINQVGFKFEGGKTTVE